MKRKRLQHHADNLAQMACGWRIVGDLKELAEVGSGRIAIDALSGEVHLDGKPWKQLSLAHELTDWLHSDAEANGIPLAQVRKAEVVLDFRAHVSLDRRAVHFDRVATSLVATDERTYTGRFRKDDVAA
jgi:hypothetical protein